ncbi:hypothetical protein Hanom_Chr16g01481031 [Helianthus anomalus]
MKVDNASKDLGDNHKWIINDRVALLEDVLMTSDELTTYLVELAKAAYKNGSKDGFVEGNSFLLEKKSRPPL